MQKRTRSCSCRGTRRAPSCSRAERPSLYLIKHVRDESHRFAITFHRELRSKGMVASILDDVPGLGPKRKKLLLKTFGSVKKMREATLDEIAAVPGIPRQVAEDLYAVIVDSNA